MRTFMFFTVLFAGFIFAIVAGYKPSMIEKEYNRIAQPIEKHFAEKRAEAWQLAKDKEWQIWSMQQMHLPNDCENSPSAVREMECNNQRQLQINTFERTWANKVASGWKPAGVD